MRETRESVPLDGHSASGPASFLSLSRSRPAFIGSRRPPCSRLRSSEPQPPQPPPSATAAALRRVPRRRPRPTPHRSLMQRAAASGSTAPLGGEEGVDEWISAEENFEEDMFDPRGGTFTGEEGVDEWISAEENFEEDMFDPRGGTFTEDMPDLSSDTSTEDMPDLTDTSIEDMPDLTDTSIGDFDKWHNSLFNFLLSMKQKNENVQKMSMESNPTIGNTVDLSSQVSVNNETFWESNLKNWVISQPRRLKGLYVHAISVILIYYAVGIGGYYVHQKEYNGSTLHQHRWSRFVDAFYITTVTFTTVGYGDIFPDTMLTMCLTIILALLGAGLFSLVVQKAARSVLDFVGSKLYDLVRGSCACRYTRFVIDESKGGFKYSVKLIIAVISVLTFIFIGALIICFVEEHGFFRAIYLSVMSVTTVGYGETSFRKTTGRCFAAIWLFVSTHIIPVIFDYISEEEECRVEEKLVKHLIQRERARQRAIQHP